MSQKLLNSYQQFCDLNGNPLAGGSLVFSETGTDTPKTVYAAEGQTSSLGSTVTLDSAGRPSSGGSVTEVYSAATGAYRITVKDASGVNVVVTENVSALLEFSALTMTGQLKLDDSTATATPPLGFDGDTDTGIARPAANTLAGVTGGTERWRTSSSGNTGFGKTSPAERIDTDGSVKADGAFYTRKGSTAVPNQTWTTVYTFGASDIELGVVVAQFAGADAGAVAHYAKLFDGGSATTSLDVTTAANAANIRFSSNAVQVYHTVGSSVTCNWAFTSFL